MSNNSISCSNCKYERSEGEGSILVIFLMTCQTSSTGTSATKEIT
jgi:hypothetical protein